MCRFPLGLLCVHITHHCKVGQSHTSWAFSTSLCHFLMRAGHHCNVGQDVGATRKWNVSSIFWVFCSASELCSHVSEWTKPKGKRPLILGNNNWSRCDNALKRFLISLWCSLHSDSKRPRPFNLHWALLQRCQLVSHPRAPYEPAGRPAVAGSGGRETLVAVRKRKGTTLNKSPRSEGDSSFVESATTCPCTWFCLSVIKVRNSECAPP